VDGGGTDDIVDGALGTGSVVEVVIGVIVGGVDGGSLWCVSIIAINELRKRKHRALSADTWRREVRSHWRA
jgi:hypothetical protein